MSPCRALDEGAPAAWGPGSVVMSAQWQRQQACCADFKCRVLGPGWASESGPREVHPWASLEIAGPKTPHQRAARPCQVASWVPRAALW